MTAQHIKRFSRLFFVVLALAVPTHFAGAANLSNKQPHVQVGIVLFDGVQIIDFAAPYEVFGTAGFSVVTLSKDGAPVTTAMGLKVTPDHAFANAPALDVLLVPGGEVGQAMKDRLITGFVRERSALATHVLSVCTGAHIMAASGILDGLEATTFHQALSGFEKDFPKVKLVRDVRWTDNGKIMTSAGLSSGIDAALHLVSRVRGMDAARSTALHMEYDWNSEGGFVRSLMADRHLPDIKPTPGWPADLKADQVSSLGDTRQWRKTLAVTSASTPVIVLAALADSVDALGQWQRIAGETAWRRQAEGKQVTLRLSAQDKAGLDQAFQLVIGIDVK